MIEQLTLVDSYKTYRKSVGEPLTKVEYANITGGLFRFMMERVWDGHDVELSGGRSLGTIAIRGSKTGKLRTDWKQTYILWNSNPQAKAANERIYYMNDHSNGISYHYCWWKEGMKIGNKKLYSFKFAKPNKRMLKKLIFEGREFIMNLKYKKDVKQANEG